MFCCAVMAYLHNQKQSFTIFVSNCTTVEIKVLMQLDSLRTYFILPEITASTFNRVISCIKSCFSLDKNEILLFSTFCSHTVSRFSLFVLFRPEIYYLLLTFSFQFVSHKNFTTLSIFAILRIAIFHFYCIRIAVFA